MLAAHQKLFDHAPPWSFAGVLNTSLIIMVFPEWQEAITLRDASIYCL